LIEINKKKWQGRGGGREGDRGKGAGLRGREGDRGEGAGGRAQ